MTSGFLGGLGLVAGVTIGLFVRDNYLYSMSEKMDDIQQDYEEINSKSVERLKKQVENVRILQERVKVIESKYLEIKEKVILGEDEGNFFNYEKR